MNGLHLIWNNHVNHIPQIWAFQPPQLVWENHAWWCLVRIKCLLTILSSQQICFYTTRNLLQIGITTWTNFAFFLRLIAIASAMRIEGKMWISDDIFCVIYISKNVTRKQVFLLYTMFILVTNYQNYFIYSDKEWKRGKILSELRASLQLSPVTNFLLRYPQNARLLINFLYEKFQ